MPKTVFVSSQPAPSKPITSPATGTPIFATFPGFAIKGTAFPPGPIFLREGKQHPHQAHNGFGIEHIWRRHFAKIEDRASAASVIARLVADILSPGSQICYETGEKCVVARSPLGWVVLGLRHDGRNDPVYSVISMYLTPRGGPSGTPVATMR